MLGYHRERAACSSEHSYICMSITTTSPNRNTESITTASTNRNTGSTTTAHTNRNTELTTTIQGNDRFTTKASTTHPGPNLPASLQNTSPLSQSNPESPDNDDNEITAASSSNNGIPNQRAATPTQSNQGRPSATITVPPDPIFIAPSQPSIESPDHSSTAPDQFNSSSLDQISSPTTSQSNNGQTDDYPRLPDLGPTSLSQSNNELVEVYTAKTYQSNPKFPGQGTNSLGQSKERIADDSTTRPYQSDPRLPEQNTAANGNQNERSNETTHSYIESSPGNLTNNLAGSTGEGSDKGKVTTSSQVVSETPYEAFTAIAGSIEGLLDQQQSTTLLQSDSGSSYQDTPESPGSNLGLHVDTSTTESLGAAHIQHLYVYHYLLWEQDASLSSSQNITLKTYHTLHIAHGQSGRQWRWE